MRKLEFLWLRGKKRFYVKQSKGAGFVLVYTSLFEFPVLHLRVPLGGRQVEEEDTCGGQVRGYSLHGQRARLGGDVWVDGPVSTVS